MGFKKLKATISGRVQGVGFRFFCQRTAQLIGVTGWVRNLPNGGVELEAVGSEDKVREFLMTVENGPSLSYVDEVRHSIEETDYNDYSNFEIVY